MLVDTHAHIHFDEFAEDLDEIFDNCRESKVKQIITVGTNEADSKKALEFVWNETVTEKAKGVDLFATAGLHPHDANKSTDALLTIEELVKGGGYGDKLVAVGECGLDYYRNNSEKHDQYRALEFQIELALELDLPLVFHVRDAWDDFFSIIRNYPNTRGVVHSFTGGPEEVEKVTECNLYFGLNGIMTFTKEQAQLEAVRKIPTDRVLLETDCPFLSPNPVRGKRNEPANIKYIADYIAKLCGFGTDELGAQTTHNALSLFGLK